MLKKSPGLLLLLSNVTGPQSSVAVGSPKLIVDPPVPCGISLIMSLGTLAHTGGVGSTAGRKIRFSD